MTAMGRKLGFTGHLGLRGPDRPLFRHSARSTDPLDQIDFLAGAGFSGVQDNYAGLRSPQEQEAVSSHAARLGLAMGSFVHDPLGWSQPRWSVTDAEGRHQLTTSFRHTLETGRRIGGRIVTCVTGLDPARERAEQQRAMIENLLWAGDLAGKDGVLLCVEATSPRWLPDMLVEQLPDAIAIVKAVDHPAVRLMLDIGHVAMNGDDPVEAIAQARDLIGAVQLADMPAGEGPGRIDVGGGTVDWIAVLRAIGDTGYDGLFEIEHEPEIDSKRGEALLLTRLRTVAQAV